jgi:PAS domain-containing protein
VAGANLRHSTLGGARQQIAVLVHGFDVMPAPDAAASFLRKRYMKRPAQLREMEQTQIQPFNLADRSGEEFWHLPGGKSIRIVTQQHLQGGAFALFEDITERLRLESALILLTQVQKATLDEGIAIFGTDGRLVLHNALFTKMWQLSENELDNQPHFAEIANLCTDRIRRDGIWGIVSCGVNSATPERFGEWGNAKRADGRTISLALSRLPNGATVVTLHRHQRPGTVRQPAEQAGRHVPCGCLNGPRRFSDPSRSPAAASW